MSYKGYVSCEVYNYKSHVFVISKMAKAMFLLAFVKQNIGNLYIYADFAKTTFAEILECSM